MGRQWSFFGKKQPEPESEPVRSEQVERLANLLAEEDDAMLFDAPGSPFYAESQALLEAALRHSTDAEYRAARALRHQESKDGPTRDLRRASTPKPPPPSASPTPSRPAPSPAPAETPIGGTAMSSIDEVRSVLALSGEKSERALAALQQAVLEVEEIQQLLDQATAGSSQTSAQQAVGLYAQSKDSLGELQGVLQAARGAVDEYAAGL